MQDKEEVAAEEEDDKVVETSVVDVTGGVVEDVGEEIVDAVREDVAKVEEVLNGTVVSTGGALLLGRSLAVVGAGLALALVVSPSPFPPFLVQRGPLHPLQPFAGHGRSS